nr:MAG TPA: Baseplate component [Caudoviricetes sp.]
MKRHVQMTGVRRWAGNDLIELQQQPLQAIDAFFAQYGNCILKGCEVQAASDNTYNITPGFVALAGTDQDSNETFKVVPFAGIEGVTLPIYLTLIHSIIERPYTDGKVKPVAYDFRAAASSILPENVPYLEISVTGGRQFVDAIRLTEKLDQTGNGRDVTVTFAQAAKRENIFSGEKLSVLWGKVCRWLADLKDVAFSGKAADLTQDTNNRLVSDTEKTGWNDKYTKTETDQKLKGKADSVHVHAIENITNLQSKLDEKYPKTGFGNLSINASGIPIIKNNSSYAAFTATGAPVDILSIKENNDIYVGYRNSILHLLGTSVKNAAGNDFFHSGNLIPYALQNRGTKIPDGSDLNDYKEFGNYFVEASQFAATIKNTPWVTNGYRLIVQAGYGEKMWMYQIAFGSSEIAYRIANSALVFTEWRYVSDKASLYTALSGKADKIHTHPYEPAFSKNTAFNKSFGTTTGTVAEGNHAHYSLEPKLINGNSDLNDYVVAGMYYCSADATVATLLNCPSRHAFSLLVEKHAGTRQTLTEYMREPFHIFVRNKYSNTWGPWHRIYTTIDKPTPAEIGAAATSHTHPYEPAFSKNTAFNKNFGTAAGTVAQGNHTHSGVVRFVAQYRIDGSSTGVQPYKMSGDDIFTMADRSSAGRYAIRHNMNTLDYIIILDGKLTTSQNKPAKVSLMEQNNLLISVVCSDNETPKDSSFYITILRY